METAAKTNDDGWDDEPAPAKSNGKRLSEWNDDDDWGSAKKPRTNGNHWPVCYVVFVSFERHFMGVFLVSFLFWFYYFQCLI